MKHRLIACGVVLIGAVTVGTAVAQGGPPGAGSVAPGKPALAGKPDDKAKAPPGKPEGAPGKAHEEHGKPDAAGGKVGGPRGKGGAFRALIDDIKLGKVKKTELKEHLGKLKENVAERRAEHQSELKARWGATLAMPAARQELEQHARRMARLNRALLVAETELTKDKDKVVERIQKLIEKEQERHEAALTRLKGMPATPAASAAPSPSAATALGGEK